MIHKTTRSILSVLLAALLLVTSVPLTPAFAGGGGVSLQSESAEGRALEPAADGVYYISSAEELKEFADKVNDTSGQYTDIDAVLTANIDLSEICSEEEGVSWTPIGNSSGYSGTFNGDGHTISGLYIDSTADDQGLFGYVGSYVGTGGTVKDLSVSGSVSGNNFVGGVVGDNSGTVINCAFSGSVKGSGIYVGGVVGLNSSGDSSASASVTNCYNTGTVTGPDSGSGSYVGGVVGSNSFSATVTNCYNTGKVSGPDSVNGETIVNVGGVVGSNSFSATVTNCYNTGEVSGLDSGSDSNVGGVVGQNFGGTVENCYNIGEVSSLDSGSDSNVGGVVGQNGGNVENCYNTGKVSGPDSVNGETIVNVGGVVGSNDSGISASASVTNCYFLKTTGVNESLPGIGNDEDAEGAAAVNDLTALCDALEGDTWTISENLNRPVLKDNHEDDGSEQHPYEIFTAAQLENFRDIVNGPDGNPAAHAVLMENITLNSSEEWTPIGTSSLYSGTFDGNGKTINIYTTADYQGLFGYVYGGTVKNLNVSGTVSNVGAVGGIVNVNSGRVENCTFSGSVKGSGVFVGGVVGNNGGTVTGCIFSGSGSVTGVTGSSYVGGVVGYSSGGVGASASVTNCYNTGEVSGGEDVGGVVGHSSINSSVTNCYNIGEVSGPDSVNGETTVNVGGVVGDNRSSVKNCYNTGEVSGIGSVGGIVGYNVDFDGYSASVENCYNTGTVSDGTTSGGVVGQNSGSVTNCYFLQTADVNKDLQGIGSGTGTATEKDDTAFHSGEVAYLLGEAWGQSALGTKDSWPTLVALNPDAAKKVYQLTFDWSYGGAPEGTTTTTNVYTNGSVTIPEINHDRAGYHISGWKDASGAPVTTETAVTADTIYTAEWTANTYTITVTAGSGGAVSGGGTFTENSKVTVTATPATGYHFVNWTENGTEVSTEATFTFYATVDRNLIAIFAKNEEPEPTPTPTPDPEPTGPSTGDSTGWDDIRDELENAENGDEITIDMGDETKVPAEIFETIAGKDVEISFDLGDVQWSVNGADIPTDTDFTDLDLGVNLDTHGIPVNVINAITGEVGTVQITLAHDGDFGFTMTLTAPLGVENAGYWANLYHYDEDAEALNFEAAAKIDETGSVTIPFSHASQYAIVIDTHSHAAVDVSDIFLDVAPNAWYKDAVQYAYDNGLMTGVSATEFAPEQTTTRAMIVSILARLEGVTTAQAAGFADVDDNDWYATAVNWAAGAGVVNGYEDNTFRPNTAITREQLAAILMNYAAYKGEDVSNRADLTSYTDQPSTWAEEAMSWAVAEGLISGVTADTLQPQGAATRAQVAAILQRFLEA